jgi:hypothetical protein
MSSLRLKILRPVSLGPEYGGDKQPDDVVDCDENLGLPLVVCGQADYAELEEPTLTSIDPAVVYVGYQDEVIALQGTNFTPGSRIVAGIVEVPTLYVNPNKVQGLIRMSQFPFPVNIALKVRIAQGGTVLETDSLTLEIQEPA